MFHLSNRSLNNAARVDYRLIEIAKLAITISKIDFGIPNDGGYRSASQQQRLFVDGKSKCDGYKNKSYHQTGNALDFYAYVNGKASWNPRHLSMVAAAFLQAASILGYQLEWGGLFKNFNDMPHVQLKKRTKLISKFNRLFKRRL